jgi:hypothetical protein
MGVLSDETLDLIPAKFFATNAGKDRIFGQTVPFAQQAREDAGLCRMQSVARTRNRAPSRKLRGVTCLESA